MKDKYLFHLSLRKTSRDFARLALNFTRSRISEDRTYVTFPFSLEFYSYAGVNDNLWREWTPSDIRLDSVGGFYNLREIEEMMRVIRKHIAAVRNEPKDIINALVGKDFKLVYYDRRTGTVVDKLDQLDCRRWSATAKNPENGNLITIGRVMARDEEHARSQIAQELIRDNNRAIIDSWMDNSANVYEDNYEDLGDYWYMTVDQMINFPNSENAIKLMVEKEDSNA